MATFNIEEYLNSLPYYAKTIRIINRNLTYIPDLSSYTNIKVIHIYGNQLTELPKMSDSVVELHCSNNQLTSIKSLPPYLHTLRCSNNNLKELPELPSSLVILSCHSNQLVDLPKLPNNMKQINCRLNRLKKLPYLPASIDYLDCRGNEIEHIPAIWNAYIKLFCDLNTLPISDYNTWRSIYNFKYRYYKLKYGPRLERYFLNVIKKKKQQINNELLYSPNLKFYKQFADPITLETMKN